MNLLVSSKQRVLHIILNRPEKRNALNAEICGGIVAAISEAQQRDDIGCVMIAATGTVFCSGMDLDEASEIDEAELAVSHDALFSLGSQSLKPIVMAVQGAALGGGLGLVAQGHIVFAGEGVIFGLPEIRVGMWPFLVHRSVSAALGLRRTLELSLTGQSLTAEHACNWGLVYRVCPGAELHDRATSMARHLAKASPLALSCGMQYLRDSAGKPWKESGEIGKALRAKLMESADFKEGILAFKQKREPRWPRIPPDFYDSKTDM